MSKVHCGQRLASIGTAALHQGQLFTRSRLLPDEFLSGERCVATGELAGEAKGSPMMCPQDGHLIRLPANWSFAFKFLLQPGHCTLIDMARPHASHRSFRNLIVGNIVPDRGWIPQFTLSPTS
jgi:hypothetical protein